MTAHATTRPTTPRRRGVLATLAAALALVAVMLPGASPAGAARPHSAPAVKPTIVLIHGAFADASGWSAVTSRLQDKGYTVYAPANPLRGLANDSAYLASFLATIRGPLVVVGHSYGGAVISNAANGNPNVKALVYVAAYALAQGETVRAANSLGGHPEQSLLLPNVVTRPYPHTPQNDGDMDVYIRPDRFRQVFAADLSPRTTDVMATAQRPGTLFSLGTPSGTPAWMTIPSWYLVCSNDRTIPPSAERVMAARAHARTVNIRSSHAAMISHSGVTTQLILDAARS